jgi:pyridoxamine 5'-phosphate oxidase
MDEFYSRSEYKRGSLRRSELNPYPIEQFSKWFSQAEGVVPEPNAMALATANHEGIPSCRMVLLKAWGPNGFVFLTNSNSRKGQELKARPQAAITFFWQKLERQIRIEGNALKISPEDSDRYFSFRPRASQISAWASSQDQPVESRSVLEDKFQQIDELYKGKDVPRPSYWEGYCLVPTKIEFWQGRENRLHDRFEYRKKDDGTWEIMRLCP